MTIVSKKVNSKEEQEMHKANLEFEIKETYSGPYQKASPEYRVRTSMVHQEENTRNSNSSLAFFLKKIYSK